MKGFLYTVIVLILATSFMYIISLQKTTPIMVRNDNSVYEIRESARALYNVEIKGNTIKGKIGERIKINEFKKIVDNYNKIRNRDFKVELTPSFKCGNMRLGFSGFGGNSWNTEILYKTKVIITPEKNVVISSKKWVWSENGTYLHIIIKNVDGRTIFDEEGYINETLSNLISVVDSEGNIVNIALQNSELEITGKCEFLQEIYNNCSITNEGYIEKNSIKYQI